MVVLDHFKISQVICLGEGCGANIAARFAMKHPNRCLGVSLIHPTGSTASFMETFKDKINSWLPNRNNNGNSMSASSEAYLIWHRFGHVNSILLILILLRCFNIYISRVTSLISLFKQILKNFKVNCIRIEIQKILVFSLMLF